MFSMREIRLSAAGRPFSPLVPPGLASTNLELEVLSTLRDTGQEPTGRATPVDSKSPRVQRTRQAAEQTKALVFQEAKSHLQMPRGGSYAAVTGRILLSSSTEGLRHAPL